MTTDDFHFIDRLVGDAEAKKTARGSEALSAAERHAIAIWGASGVIGNGGFQYFFENELSAEEAAEGYEAIGMPMVAGIFRTALSLFPGGNSQSDWHESLAWIRTRPSLFDALSAGVWQADDEMISRLAAYLRDATTK